MALSVDYLKKHIHTAERVFRDFDVAISLIVIASLDLFFVRGVSAAANFLHGVRFCVNFVLSLAMLWVFLSILRSLASRGFYWRCLSALLLTGALVVQDGHFLVYREYVSSFGIAFFFANPGMIAAGTADIVPLWRGILIACFVAPLPFFWTPKAPSRVRWRAVLSVFAKSTMLVAGLPFLAFFWYSNATYQVAPVALAAALVETGRTLHFGNVKFQKPKIPKVTAAQNPPNIVWVVGESLSGRHIGLFGYNRNTTPNLQAMAAQKQVVGFSNATSIGVHTMVSVPYLLTGMQGSDPHGEIYKMPTIFDYASARGYETHFLSAQDTRWGNLSQFIGNSGVSHFVSGTQFNPNVSVHKGADDMLVLENGVKPALAKAVSPFFVMVQMDGSHYPYAEHSPPEFKKFLPEGDANSLNAYDNTVVYSDHYFRELVNAVRARDADAWIFYVSDHGESTNVENGLFHFRYGQNVIHVPLLVWPPASAFAALEKNSKKPVSQVDIFPTILEVMGVNPVVPVDGISLLGEIPSGRLRMVSKNMATLQPHPSAALVYPDFTFLEVDYTRSNVTLRDGKTVVPMESIDPALRARFERRVR